MRLSSIVLATVSLGLASCSLSPTYHRPDSPVAGRSIIAPPQSSDSAAWQAGMDWEEFVVDPSLRKLVRRALTSNRDFRIAMLNVDVARSQYRIERSALLPSVGVDGSVSSQRQPASSSITGQAGVVRTHQAGLALSAYELDLFGRLRSLSEAARQSYQVSLEDAKTAELSVVAETCNAFVTLVAATKQEQIAALGLESRQEALRLVQLQYDVGQSSELDLQQQRSLVQEAGIKAEQARRQKLQASNALEMLVGDGSPLNLEVGNADVDRLFAPIVASLSSDVLLSRPDVQASEHALLSRNAQIGAARAAFFPQISLTGQFGNTSNELSGLFDGANRSWSFSPRITIPIFSGGANRANLDAAKIRKEVAVANFEKTILVAFQEVSDALAALDTLQGETASWLALRESSGRSLVLAKLRLDAGVDGRLTYLDAQEKALDAQLGLAQVQADRQAGLISLFKSLGGQWARPRAEVELSSPSAVQGS